jgi:hypothetical protein
MSSHHLIAATQHCCLLRVSLPYKKIIEPTHFLLPYRYIIMQGPTDEASTPTVYVINRQLLGVTVRRKKRPRTTRPWPAAARNPALPPPPQREDEDLPVTKRARLQGPTHTADGDVNAHTAERVATDSYDDTPTDPVTPEVSFPIAAASRAPRRYWRAEEDAKLMEAVKTHGNKAVQKLGKDWVAVAAMVPDRTNKQCRDRWKKSLDPANRKKPGKWSTEEDAKLKEAVKKHGKKWVEVAAMVPDRTNDQCRERWVNSLDPMNGNKGKWSTEEDAKLTEAIQKLGKDWVAAAAMVPGRTNARCRQRWARSLDPDRASNTVE